MVTARVSADRKTLFLHVPSDNLWHFYLSKRLKRLFSYQNRETCQNTQFVSESIRYSSSICFQCFLFDFQHQNFLLCSFQQLLKSKISFSRLNGVLENTMKCHVWGFPACFCPAVMGGWWYLIFHKRPISALWIRFLRRCRCSVWIWLWASSRNTTLIFNQFLSGVSSVEAFSCPPLCLCF